MWCLSQNYASGENAFPQVWGGKWLNDYSLAFMKL